MQRISCTISDKALRALNEISEKTKLKKSTIVETGIFEMYERFKQNEDNINNNSINDFGFIK